MDTINSVVDWLSKNWLILAGIIALAHELLTLLDKLLPEKITIDNHIADYIAKILKAIAPEKKTK